MNTQSLSRIITGILILVVGFGALLDALNVISFWSFAGTWWPLAIVVGGVLTFIGNRQQYITALALVGIGAILQLDNLGVVDVEVWSILWPVIIIAVGLSVLVNRSQHSRQAKTQDINTISAVFASNETINKSQDYQGGKATAVFGGVSIDLRDAKIAKEATLEVFALCGGIELKVPREWKVEHKVFPILGGIESKAHSDKVTDKSPVLYITGTVALGGVDVKS